MYDFRPRAIRLLYAARLRFMAAARFAAESGCVARVHERLRVHLRVVLVCAADNAAEDSPTTAGRGFRSIGHFRYRYTYLHVTTINSYLWQSPCVHAATPRVA